MADTIDRRFFAEEFARELEREKLAALKQFAYGLSHEINNPLTNIATRAQMLLAGESDPARRKALESINAQAFRAFEMIADLMLFAHPPRPEFAAFNVAELLDEVLRQFLPGAREQKTDLRRLISSDTPATLVADRAQIAAALAALIRNALEALRTGGEVAVHVAAVELAEGEPAIEFAVQDNGPGIPPETRRHLFDPFFSGREAGRGLGLGLCKAWRIAEMHGGGLVVESEPGRGSVFRLQIARNPENPLNTD